MAYFSDKAAAIYLNKTTGLILVVPEGRSGDMDPVEIVEMPYDTNELETVLFRSLEASGESQPAYRSIPAIIEFTGIANWSDAMKGWRILSVTWENFFEYYSVFPMVRGYKGVYRSLFQVKVHDGTDLIWWVNSFLNSWPKRRKWVPSRKRILREWRLRAKS